MKKKHIYNRKQTFHRQVCVHYLILTHYLALSRSKSLTQNLKRRTLRNVRCACISLQTIPGTSERVLEDRPL